MCKVSKIHFCRTLVCSIRMWAINAMRKLKNEIAKILS